MNQPHTDIMFETLFECSPDACLLIENNRFIKCNQAAVNMLRADSKEQIFNTHPSAISPAVQPDGRNSFEKAEEMMANATRYGSTHFEWMHKRMDGEEFPVDVSLTLIRDGESVIIYTVWRDISDRKRAEAEAREKDAQIRLLLKSTAEGIYGSDTNGVCTFCNPAGLQLLGYDREDQLLGRKIHDLIHHTKADGSSYPAAECRAFDAFRFTSQVHVDDELFWRRDGSSFSVEYWSHPILENGEARGAVVAFFDITARRQSEEALLQLKDTLQDQNEELAVNEESLREQNDQLLATEEMLRIQINEYEAGQKLLQESEEKYRKLSSEQQIILNSSSVGIIFVKNRKVLWANPAFCALFGYEVGTVTNMDTAAYYADQDSYESVGKRAYPVTASGDIFSEDVSMRKKGGAVIWCNIVGQAVNPQNPDEGSIWSVLDITARKRAEEERIQLENQLRQSQKMELVGTLTSGLSHDFNNVLTGIIGTASVLRMQIDRGKELGREQLCTKLDTVIDLSNRAADIVSQLMVISRKQETHLVPIDLRGSISHIVKICRNTIDKAIELDINIPDEPFMINADSVQIEQVLLNLCVNASHAMTIMRKAGETLGGKLTIKAERMRPDRHFCLCHPEAAANAEYSVLSIRDTGTGMNSITLAKIFDPFFTTKEKGKGTGLGLSMVYTIVQQHGGFIEVHSEPGTGSVFNIYLPLLSGTAVQGKIHEIDTIRSGEGLILVVDDEPLIREAAQAMLEECGYQVLLAENGEEAVTAYKEHGSRIKAIVMDLIMPKKSGMAAYLEIKQICPDVKVLFVSGYIQDERLARLAETGFKEIIKKPFTMSILAEALANAIAQRKVDER